MIGKSLHRIFVSSCMLLVLTLAACGNTTANTSNGATPTPVSTRSDEVSTNPTLARSTPTPDHLATTTPTVSTPVSRSGNGPMVILTPTHVPGGSVNSQLIKLQDRTLAIQSVSKQQGNDANSTAVTLVMTMQNTGNTSIPNQAAYYQLIGSEGDMFGFQSSATASFFGTIAPHASRSGTIVFQVPTAAISGLRLLFRSELADETVFVPLTIS
ncbi:MAG: DUF4352 domain-containing protein [Ktedonobacteraceae bacterium]